MAEWRECELRHDERTTRFGRVKADCDLGIGDERGIGPSICAECPVPDDRRDAKKWRECGAALVEAVGAAAEPTVLEHAADARYRAIYRKARAALDKAKGEEARDAT